MPPGFRVSGFLSIPPALPHRHPRRPGGPQRGSFTAENAGSAGHNTQESAMTPKQEAFALAYFETGNAAEAYRRAYDVSENAKDQWLYVEASQLLDHPEVALRLQELEEQARALSMFTRQKALDEYEEARQIALREGSAAAAVGATTGKVKLFGLEAPTRSRLEHVGKNDGPIQTEEVSPRDRIASRIARLAPRDGESGDTGGSD